jgi:hypothetical protein
MNQFLTGKALAQIVQDNVPADGSSITPELEGVIRARDDTLIMSIATDEFVITNCGHFCKSIDKVPGGTTEKNYNLGEGACSICKKPINLLVPVFCSAVNEELAKTTPESDNKDLYSLDNFLKAIQQNLESQAPNPYLSQQQYSQESVAKLSAEVACLPGSLFKLLPSLIFKQSNKDKYPDTFADSGKMAMILINMFKTIMHLSDSRGFGHTATSFAQVYSNLYLALRLLTNTLLAEVEPSENTKNYFKTVNREIGYCFSRCFDQDGTADGAMQIDVAQMYATIVPRMVEVCLTLVCCC